MILMHQERMTYTGGQQDVCVFRLRLKGSMEYDERILRGLLKSKWQGQINGISDIIEYIIRLI